MSALSDSAVISSLFNISFPFRSSSTSSALFFGLTSLLNALRFCSKQRLILEVPSISMGLRPKRYVFSPRSSVGIFYRKSLKFCSWFWVLIYAGLVLVLKYLGVFTKSKNYPFS